MAYTPSTGAQIQNNAFLLKNLEDSNPITLIKNLICKIVIAVSKKVSQFTIFYFEDIVQETFREVMEEFLEKSVKVDVERIVQEFSQENLKEMAVQEVNEMAAAHEAAFELPYFGNKTVDLPTIGGDNTSEQGFFVKFLLNMVAKSGFSVKIVDKQAPKVQEETMTPQDTELSKTKTLSQIEVIKNLFPAAPPATTHKKRGFFAHLYDLPRREIANAAKPILLEILQNSWETRLRGELEPALRRVLREKVLPEARNQVKQRAVRYGVELNIFGQTALAHLNAKGDTE